MRNKKENHMYEWNNVQIKTELEFILKIIKERTKNSKIKRIFSKDAGVPQMIDGKIVYDLLDEPLYILFEDNWCLIITFLFYSEIYIEYREIKPEELKDSISPVDNKEIDYFNCHHEVYGWDFDENRNRIEESFRVKHVYDVKGEYDLIKDFKVRGFHDEYDKWVSDGRGSDIITVPAGGDYFDALIIVLNNGVEIGIYPDDADSDGYYSLVLKDPNRCLEYNLEER